MLNISMGAVADVARRSALPSSPGCGIGKRVTRKSKAHLPRHIGFIPDGNRRWALEHGFAREAGYRHGVDPGLQLFDLCSSFGIEEISVYGFTQDNTRRPSVQTEQFRRSCTVFAHEIARRGSSLLVLGDDNIIAVPREPKAVSDAPRRRY